MDKVIVPFREARGSGNILSPKTSFDFEPYKAKRTSSSKTVNGISMKVYTLKYSIGGLVLSITQTTVNPGDTVTITATLTNESGNPVQGATVKFYKEE